MGLTGTMAGDVGAVAPPGISSVASASSTYGGALKLATGLRLENVISFEPAHRVPLGMVNSTLVHAAFAPSPWPSQFGNGLGPE